MMLFDIKRVGYCAASLLFAASSSATAAISTERVVTGLNLPVYATSAPDDYRRMFVVEQGGTVGGRAAPAAIRIVDLQTRTVSATPLLSITTGITTGGEQGLLGMAFDPDYRNNGFFYVNLTNGSGNTEIRRYTVNGNPLTATTANPASNFLIMTYTQPQANHNGGWIAFNPKTRPDQPQYLYIASGDGGNANDQGSGHTEPGGNAQDITSNMLGKMLRIDPSGDDFPAVANKNYRIPPSNPFVGVNGDDEIWAYGLRNPWRNSFDRQTGDLYIADVGQGAREEINYQPADAAGRNYGWRLREGTQATPGGGVGGNRPAGAIDPIHEYLHNAAGGFSITGGYVYRGGRVPELAGHYLFADYVSNKIWSFKYDGVNKTEFVERTTLFDPPGNLAIQSISSFAEDNVGNVYILDRGANTFNGGELYLIVPEPGSAVLVLGALAGFLARRRPKNR
jgi:glucose/arabinose dehydrogenase